MASKKPFNIDNVFPRDLEPVSSAPFPFAPGPIKPNAKGRPKGTAAVSRLPDRVPIPQMTLADGTRYRWEKTGCSSYKLLSSTPDGEDWAVRETGHREQAIAWAKKLRAQGGTHPFKSVTHLVARSFPIVLDLERYWTVMTEGGPGHSFNVSALCILELRAHADDRLELTSITKQRGFGWTDNRIHFCIDIPTPLSADGLRSLRDGFNGYPPREITEMAEQPEQTLERIFTHFPWIEQA